READELAVRSVTTVQDEQQIEMTGALEQPPDVAAVFGLWPAVPVDGVAYVIDAEITDRLERLPLQDVRPDPDHHPPGAGPPRHARAQPRVRVEGPASSDQERAGHAEKGPSVQRSPAGSRCTSLARTRVECVELLLPPKVPAQCVGEGDRPALDQSPG